MSVEEKPAKISDIARVAGVSAATVCRVLNDKTNVKEDLRVRVMQASEQLGYKPQRVHNKTEPWLVVLAESSINAFYAQVLSSIQEQALEKGYMSYIVQMPQNSDKKTEVLNQIGKQNWSGIISTGFSQQDDVWIKLQEEMQVPIVIMNSTVSHPNIACLRVNFTAAIGYAIQHLTGLGHRRIAYLGDLNDQFSRDELTGVELALQQHGASYPEEYKISVTHTAAGASQGLSQIMMLPPENRPTAIIAFDDEFAIHIMNALRYHNLSVPDDMSLVGFDNIPMAARTYTPLTTIDIPKYRVGQQLVELMLQLIENKPDKPIGYMVVDGTLVVRSSTGPVKDAF